MNEKQIDKELMLHEEQIKVLEQLKIVAKSRKWWKCRECGRQSILGQLKVGIEQHYIEPSGCTGGDYWTQSDEPPYHIECPHCNKTVRHTTWNKMWIKIRKNLDGFKEIGYGAMLNPQGGRWSPLGSPPLKFVFDKPRRGYLDVY